jgi:hypothetical protein
LCQLGLSEALHEAGIHIGDHVHTRVLLEKVAMSDAIVVQKLEALQAMK